VDRRRRVATGHAVDRPASQAPPASDQIVAEIAKLGPCLPGSLVTRMTRCGTPTCHCANDPAQRHGPYPTWIRKVGTRTVTRTLKPAQLERYGLLFENTKRLRELIAELEALAAEVVERAENWERR
jgi:hypothetical protein